MITMPLGFHRVNHCGHIPDEGVHINPGGQKTLHIAIVRLVIGMARDEIHIIIGMFQHCPFPFAERVHGMAGRTADDQIQIRVKLLHSCRSLGRHPGIINRIAMA